MQSLVYTLCGLEVVGLFILFRATFAAPEGAEDERGFHFLDASDNERYLAAHHPALSEGDVLFFK